MTFTPRRAASAVLTLPTAARRCPCPCGPARSCRSCPWRRISPSLQLFITAVTACEVTVTGTTLTHKLQYSWSRSSWEAGEASPAAAIASGATRVDTRPSAAEVERRIIDARPRSAAPPPAPRSLSLSLSLWRTIVDFQFHDTTESFSS